MLLENHGSYDLISLNSPIVQQLQHNCVLGSTQPELQKSLLHNYLQHDPYLFNMFMDNLEKVQNSPTIPDSNRFIYQIWKIIMFFQFALILVYIPLQNSFQLLNLNYTHISVIIVNLFISFHQTLQFEKKFINLKFIIVKSIINSKLIVDIVYFIHLIDQFIIAMLLLNNIHISLQLDWIVMILIQGFITRKLTKLWRRFFQYKLDFYLENVLTLIFKIAFILNTITCFHNIFYRRSDSDNIENSFIDGYIASGKASLCILSFNYQQDHEEIEIRLISFFALFFDVYIFQSFHKILSELNIEIHTYFQQNNFNFVLREQLLNSIAVHNREKKIHFPQRLADEIKVNQRLPLLKNYFKGYDVLLLTDIAIKSEEITYHPNQSIINEGIPDDCSLYFLLDGYAEIRSSSFILHKISAPYVFGEMSFYSQQLRLASIVAITKCIILKVPRQVLIVGLGQVEKELFHEQKDQISLYSNLPIKCFCCKSTKHCIVQCNVFRIQINPEMTYSLTQTRFDYRRNSKKRLSIILEQKKSQLTLSPCKSMYQAGEQLISANCLRENSDQSVPLEDKIYFNQGEQSPPKKFLSSQESNKLIHDQTFNLQLQASELKNFSVTIDEKDKGNELSQQESEFSKIPKYKQELNSPLGVGMYSAMVMSSFQETQVNQDFTFMRLLDFDRFQLYQKYFPQGNIDRILQNIH